MTDFDADIETTLLDNYERVLNYVRQKVGPDYAEDVTQTAMLRAIAAMRRGNGATEHVTGWLWRIVNTTIIDHYRSRGREPIWIDLDAYHDNDEAERLEAELVTTEEMSPFEIVEQNRVAEHLHRSIARLPDMQEQVTTYRLHGYDYQELGDVLGKSRGAIKAIQQRAYVGLREMLGVAA